MKKSAKSQGPRNLDKHLFEAGLQCHKRLWFDSHEPAEEAPSPVRAEMSRVGEELLRLARSAFPRGVTIDDEDVGQAAERTRELIEGNTPVLFGATFVDDGVEARCDILVLHKDREVDLFEIKSGTKVKHRYVNDLALQANVLERCGLTVKRAYLLHVNPKYTHRAGDDYPPMQLLRSADVTEKVMKQKESVARRLQQLRIARDNESVLDLPMGTFCRTPFPCPYIARCQRDAPPLPLTRLPELHRNQEIELHKEGIEDLSELAPDRKGLTFRQRRTLKCIQENRRIVEPFVQEELYETERPLHFLAIAVATDPLPQFDLQRPWQRTPYAWAVHTIHEGGREEIASFAQLDRDDPRGNFVKSLAEHLEIGGTILCWDDEPIREMRTLLDSVPGEKASVRALLGQEHLDMMKLFEAGVFDPGLDDYGDFAAVVATLLGDPSGRDHAALDRDYRFEMLSKARAPRVRSATRDKLAAELLAALDWQATQLVRLFETFSGLELRAPADVRSEPKQTRAARPLPKLPE